MRGRARAARPSAERPVRYLSDEALVGRIREVRDWLGKAERERVEREVEGRERGRGRGRGTGRRDGGFGG